MAQIIFALDFDDIKEAKRWIKRLKRYVNFFKIGYQLFTKYGIDSLKVVKDEGKDIFLDLKLFDIPEVCGKAVENAAKFVVYSITVHLLSGKKAVEYAKKSQINGYPHIWGVTVLSSLKGDSLKLAEIGAKCDVEGFIVSGEDVRRLKRKYPEKEIVVPGIRPKGTSRHTHKKVLTPEEAIKLGADFLVMGRAIREAKYPLRFIKSII
ncbi:MAG: orotidine-5'-phosphate decarboxylase [Caldiserica bacterium]|nr:MAG: orotidine-5'-phosphate decarboxylase [Caldisericota bacterium]